MKRIALRNISVEFARFAGHVLLLVGLTLLATLCLLAQPAYAATVPVTSTLDSGPGSLRQAVRDAVIGDSIAVSPALTITLTSGQIVITKSLTIDGGTDSSRRPTISGSAISRTFQIATGVNVVLSGLRIDSAECNACNGGAIYNQGGLSVINVVLADNGAPQGKGGAIYNDASGTLNLISSTLSANSALGGSGGGVYNNGGTLSAMNTTLANNTAAGGNGGAIYSTIGKVGLTNSTLAANSALYGGGVYLNDGTLTATSATLAGNSAPFGGGFYNGGAVTLKNTIIANSLLGDNCSNPFGTITDSGHNLDSSNTCGLSAADSFSGIDPLLAPLSDYGGPAQTIALLPSSPTIDAGLCAGVPTTDQRGVARPQGAGCDIGAFESRGFGLAGQSGTPQATPVNTAFVRPLALTVTSAFSEPVAGGQVLFSVTADPSGASANPVTQTVPIAQGGVASETVTANSIYGGPYDVTASTHGMPASAHFALTNLCGPMVITVTNANDSGSGSLRQAVADACPGGTIHFDAPMTITLTSGQITIDKSLTIDGSSVTPTVSGNHAWRVFYIPTGVSAKLDGLHFVNGHATCPNCDGGAIDNNGTLLVANSTFSSNLSDQTGGAIVNGNMGRLVISNTLISGNRANWGGGGLESFGVVSITNSSFVSNSGADKGGAIFVAPGGSSNLVNTTIADNSAVTGGGGILNWNATLTVLNSTVVGNNATTGPGGIYNYDTGLAILTSTILSNNGTANCGSNAQISAVIDGGHNIDSGNTCGFSPYALTHSLSNTDPLLGTLGDYGGPVLTIRLLPSSPAIDAGDDAACPSTDARGVHRPFGVHCDIGAYEATFTVKWSFMPLIRR